MNSLKWVIGLILISLCIIKGELEDIQSVEIDPDGSVVTEKAKERIAKVDDNPPKHPNSLEVIFENQSGKTVELYWDDSKSGILQGVLDNTNQITVNTFLGHRFYYTPSNSSGSKDNMLHIATMMEHTGLVTLYNPKIMESRGEEFEKKKSIWMKEYYEKTGRRWQNFYPREPITHYYHTHNENGQIIKVKTDRTQFNICTEQQLNDDILAELKRLEDDWNENDQPKLPSKCDDEPDDDDCKRVPPSFQMDTTDLYIAKYNNTIYCRLKKEITYDITCICAHGPHAFRLYEFLSNDEIEVIKNIGMYIGLKRSTVSEEALKTIDRTSQTVWLERSKSFIIDNIVRRIADVTVLPQNLLFLNASSESLQLVHYFGGELYKSHVDYGTDRPHNRYITFLMYLHDVTEGGNTSFPKANEKCRDHNNYFGVKPIKRSVMFFYNLFPDGNVDTSTQHYAEPPVDSEKWMTNLWIWDKVFTR